MINRNKKIDSLELISYIFGTLSREKKQLIRKSAKLDINLEDELIDLEKEILDYLESLAPSWVNTKKEKIIQKASHSR